MSNLPLKFHQNTPQTIFVRIPQPKPKTDIKIPNMKYIFTKFAEVTPKLNLLRRGVTSNSKGRQTIQKYKQKTSAQILDYRAFS